MTVVSLRGRDDPDPESAKRGRLLERCGELALEQLRAALAQMLDRADDALFELAEKAGNDALQRTYFDAMREVRLKRAEIEELYAREFGAGVALLLRAPVPARGGGAHAIDIEALGLVDQEAVEEDIAISNMVAKIASAGREEIYALDRRVAFLLGRTEGDPGENPLGPKAICAAMRAATRPIESGIEVRLLVLKLFDRYVAGSVTAIHRVLNRYLIEHQVLPDIRPAVRRAPGVVPRAVAGAGVVPALPGTAAATAPGEAALLELLRSLVAQGGGDAAATLAGGVVLPAAALASLTGLQHGAGTEAAAAGLDPQALAAGTVNVVRPLAASAVLAGLEGPQRMTVDIVALLFDYILADPALPDTLKAQIGRLQIPMVKVALLDPAFFSRRSHPARRLLDLLAEAAARVRDDGVAAAALQAQAEKSVQRVLQEFDSDVTVFGAIVAELGEFLASGLAEAAARAGRVDRAVHGRERLEQAKVYARNAVERCVARHGHDELVYSFLLNHWKTLIITSHVECGEDSAAVADAVQTMDDLAWSVTPKRETAERERLTAMLPGLVRRLQRGMQSVAAPVAARTRFLERLALRHAELARATPSAAAARTAAPRLEDACERTLPEGLRADALTTGEDVCERTLPEGTPAVSGAAAAADCERTLPGDAQAGAVIAGDDPCERTLPEGLSAAGMTLPAAAPAPDAADAGAEPAAAGWPCGAGPDGDEAPVAAAGTEVDLDPIDVPIVAHAAGAPAAFASTADLARLFELAAGGGVDVDELLAGGEFEVEDLTLGDDAPADPDAADPHAAAVASLRPGTWLEFELERGRVGRGQLATNDGTGDALQFVDRQGRRIADRTRAGLAADLRRGSARIVATPDASAPLLERAFGRLLDGLGGSTS